MEFIKEHYRCGTCVLEVAANNASVTFEVTALRWPTREEPKTCICGSEVTFYIRPKA